MHEAFFENTYFVCGFDWAWYGGGVFGKQIWQGGRATGEYHRELALNKKYDIVGTPQRQHRRKVGVPTQNLFWRRDRQSNKG